jgi:hypothetical protein
MGTNQFTAVAPKLDQRQATYDLAQAQAARGRQTYLLNELQSQMDGRGPTVAGQQAQQGIQQALANAGHQAANARGISRALAQRSATYAGQNAMEAANRDAGLMRAQEQISAGQQYGQTAGQMRTGDVQQRSLSLDAAKANQAAQMQAEGYNTQISEGNATRKQKGTGSILSGIGGAVKGLFSDINAKEDVQPLGVDTAAGSQPTFADKLRTQLAVPQAQPQQDDPSRLGWMVSSSNAGYGANQAGLQQAATDTNTSNAGADTSGSGMSAGGIGGAIGGGIESFGNGLISDERSKRDLAPLQPYSFTYRPGFAAMMAEQAASGVPPAERPAVAGEVYADARAPRSGIMAQDLERSPGGKSVVRDTPVGKTLDKKRSIAFALASVAGLDKRLQRAGL